MSDIKRNLCEKTANERAPSKIDSLKEAGFIVNSTSMLVTLVARLLLESDLKKAEL